jgi:hypothetical protein
MDTSALNTPREDTHQRIASALETIAVSSTFDKITDLEAVQRLVRNGVADKVFKVGDQILTQKTLGSNTWDCPFDIVHIGTAKDKNGVEKPALYLQMHYCTSYTTLFDQTEALYYCAEALPAGTYNFTLLDGYDTTYGGGKTYYFTLTKDVPAGGVLMFPWGYQTQAANVKLSSYSKQTDTTALESVSVTAGTSGNNLGTADGKTEHMNHSGRIRYGSNRWKTSNLRQHLNSTDGTFTPQTEFDRSCAYSATSGFMSCFPEDFLSVLAPVTITTAAAPADGDNVIDTTVDTFFLPSLEEHYCKPYDSVASGNEGSAWQYWQEVSQASSPLALYGAYPQFKTYAINAHTSAQTVWLRSAYRGGAHGVFCVTSSGTVGYDLAYTGYRCAPACVIL